MLNRVKLNQNKQHWNKYHKSKNYINSGHNQPISSSSYKSSVLQSICLCTIIALAKATFSYSGIIKSSGSELLLTQLQTSNSSSPSEWCSWQVEVLPCFVTGWYATRNSSIIWQLFLVELSVVSESYNVKKVETAICSTCIQRILNKYKRCNKLY